MYWIETEIPHFLSLSSILSTAKNSDFRPSLSLSLDDKVWPLMANRERDRSLGWSHSLGALRWGLDILTLFLSLSCPFSLFTLSLSQAKGTRSFERWWVGLSPAAFGFLRNPPEVLDLNLSFLLSCSTSVVRMSFSPIN